MCSSLVSHLTLLYGYLHVIILVVSPTVGYITDYELAKGWKGNYCTA